jgi:hypothetical protein
MTNIGKVQSTTRKFQNIFGIGTMNSEELNSDIKNYSGGPLILTQPSSTRIEDNLSGPKNTTVDNILVSSFYETNTPIDNEDLIQGLKNTGDSHIDIPEISFLHNVNELSIPITEMFGIWAHHLYSICFCCLLL